MTINPIGTIYANETPTVIIPSGLRGARGLPGGGGDPGPKGSSLVLRGIWQSGLDYAPLDGVTWRSSALDGVDSLFLQSSSFPEGPSTTPPNEDPARWMEVGLTADAGLLGGVWYVSQQQHGFTKVGTPVSYASGIYALASAQNETTFAVALIREIVDGDTFILQSTGGIPPADPSLLSGGGTFVDGQVYWLSPVNGTLSATAPAGPGQLVQEIYQHGVPEGIVLPWKPVINTTITVPGGFQREKFYYTSTGGSSFRGPDDYGNTPDYTDAAVEVFQSGLNLQENVAYTFTDTTIRLTAPPPVGVLLEIWSDKTEALSAYARIPIDAILFDGVSVDYPLNVAGTTISDATVAVDLDVYLDGNPQQPEVDYTVTENGGQTQITFASAPEPQTGSWIVLIAE